MDSMRHLSTSLPRTQRRQDHSDLLTDFKAAALSVTNLYKSAAADQVKARSAGYQDALDDLLAFLDKENLGLMDGEGWRVRQWATERLVDESGARQSGSDDEEDNTTTTTTIAAAPAVSAGREQREKTRSSSPEAQKKHSTSAMPAAVLESEGSSPRRISTSEPPQQVSAVPSRQDFTFRPAHAYPPVHFRESSGASGMDLDLTPDSAASPTPESIRVIRPPRSKHSNHSRRNNPPALNFNLGSGAGNKRKVPYSDFFDISGLNFDGHERKDSVGRGAKRGRHT